MKSLSDPYPPCPACFAATVSEIFTVRDHAVSGEPFKILQCQACSLRFTFPVPDKGKMPDYYKSEDYISHHEKTKGLIHFLYRLIRKRTVRGKRKLVRKVSGKQYGSLLDVGSGTGYFAAEMLKSGWITTGLEPDEGARAAASAWNRIQLLPTEDIYLLPDRSFDVITLWHVLEHVHDLHGYLEKFYAILRPDGKLIIAVPNYESYDAAVYQSYWAAYDVPRHLYHFSPVSLKTLAGKKGFRVVAMKPMWFDSFYVSLLSSRYRHNHVKWFPALWTALRSNWKAMRDKSRCSSVIYILEKERG